MPTSTAKRLVNQFTVCRGLDAVGQTLQRRFLNGLQLDDAPQFDEWQREQTETCHQRMLFALNVLADHHLQAERWQMAQQYARHQITLEPWRETAHRQLIAALNGEGEREAALAQFDRLQEILSAELNIAPSLETVQLMQQIRSGENVALPDHNLPAQLTPFFGREDVSAQVERQFVREGRRLISLVGMGGCGKTRLALHIATRQLKNFHDGVFFVALDSVSRSDAVLTSIAEAIGLIFASDEAQEKQLQKHLGNREMLLILDNAEHLIPPIANLVSELLTALPALRILVTSRRPLNLRTESVVWLGGLPYPLASTGAALDYPAVRLVCRSCQADVKRFSAET